jgi:hypothetical protein
MRSAFDKLISGAGLALAAVLIAAGGLLVWANTFIGNQVHDQLVMQDITMPSGDALSSLPKADQNALKPYAGSVLDTGPEAKAYADHYILVHMNEASSNQTYSEISGQFIALSDEQKASPEGQQLGQLRQTLFMGNTLRGELLTAYAFGKMGTIAGIGAIVAWISGAVMLVLAGLGYWHSRRVPETSEVFTKHHSAPAIEKIP